MRKLSSILLLVVLALPMLLPLFAAGEAGLPACCRRDGKHHCMMSMTERSGMAAAEDGVSRWRTPAERCPYCPATMPSFHHGDLWGVPTAEAIFADLVAHPSGVVQTESRWRISRDRSRQKRGPPLQRS